MLAALLNIPPAQFKLVLDAIIWALKHTMRQVADTGLGILYQLLQNVAQVETAAQSFYQTYYIDIIQHLFSVVTDSSHTAGNTLSLLSVYLLVLLRLSDRTKLQMSLPQLVDWLVGCLKSHSTHNRSFWGRLNLIVIEIRLESHQIHSTMLQ